MSDFDRKSVYYTALKRQMPEWVPDELITSQVDRLLTSGANKSDYENIDLLRKTIYDFAKKRFGRWYDPVVERWPANAPADILYSQRELDTRFNQNPDAYWPAMSSVAFPSPEKQRSVALRRGTLGFVDPEEADKAYIMALPESRPDLVAHELQHSKDHKSTPVPTDYTKSKSDDAVAEERERLFSVLGEFSKSGDLPKNALEDTGELFASLVGRESAVKAGTSVLDDKVLGKVLSDEFPIFRDWYMQQRFKGGGFK